MSASIPLYLSDGHPWVANGRTDWSSFFNQWKRTAGWLQYSWRHRCRCNTRKTSTGCTATYYWPNPFNPSNPTPIPNLNPDPKSPLRSVDFPTFVDSWGTQTRDTTLSFELCQRTLYADRVWIKGTGSVSFSRGVGLAASVNNTAWAIKKRHINHRIWHSGELVSPGVPLGIPLSALCVPSFAREIGRSSTPCWRRRRRETGGGLVCSWICRRSHRRLASPVALGEGLQAGNFDCWEWLFIAALFRLQGFVHCVLFWSRVFYSFFALGLSLL